MARFRDNDRFDNYTEITAKYDSTGSCGHEIKKGERIGYNGRLRKTQCAECWRKWAYENLSAQAYEDTGFDCAYDC